MDTKQARGFLDLLGHRGDLARMERIDHPTKRNHYAYRASHPKVGSVTENDERTAWEKLCDLAEAAGPLPDRCQAETKSGDPCKNAPQKGERYCGAHLGAAAGGAEAAPGLCRARTAKGRPCQNAPQQGEKYCGPHLAKHGG